MQAVGYLFERFPSFGQTFCYREVAELVRQGLNVQVYSIREPADEPPQAWDPGIVRRVQYVPDEKKLVALVDGDRGIPPAAHDAIREWGRQSDFLRLYQAAFVGRELQRAGINHVHAHFAGMAARTAYWIAKFYGIRYSFTAHANDIFAPRPFAIGLDKLITDAAAVVSVSDFAVEFLKQKYPAAAAKIHRVYNGIDLAAFRPATFASPTASSISVGRLIEKKGFADLIDACALLRDQGLDFTCDIIGDGPLESELRRRITDNALDDQVKLAGPVPQKEIIARLERATMFVLPCAIERDGGMDNLPTVIMEAMAAGLPVVSTPIAGVPEMVGPGITGELVPAGDVPALATAMRALIENRELARRLGDGGRVVAQEKFAIENSVRALAALFTHS